MKLNSVKTFLSIVTSNLVINARILSFGQFTSYQEKTGFLVIFALFMSVKNVLLICNLLSERAY